MIPRQASSARPDEVYMGLSSSQQTFEVTIAGVSFTSSVVLVDDDQWVRQHCWSVRVGL